MSMRTLLIVGVIWVASLLAVGEAATAQARMYKRLPQPKVLTGEDVGFRVEGTYGDTPAGTIVVKVNGEWMEARLAPATPALPIVTSR